tara:strand:+ start:108 stop:524 length:417 start_codon:yes stop_codon:yes gene_type:complete
MELKFHHIGVATSNIEKAILRYKSLGYHHENEELFEDPIQKVRICFMVKDGHPIIELIEPLIEGSPIDHILQKMGATCYHTCYEVQNFEDFTAIARKNRFVQILKPTPAVAFHGKRVSFYYSKEIGIIELLENEIPDL